MSAGANAMIGIAPVRMGLGRTLAAGAIGAAVVTIANELGRRTISGSPRLDLMGSRAVAKLRAPGGFGRFVPGRRRRIRRTALAGDLALNALYYALVSPGRHPRPVGRGLLLGAVAGVGAVVLAPRLGLGHDATEATVETAALTVAWYALGGLAAGIAARALAPKADELVLAPGGSVAVTTHPWAPAHRV